MHGDMSIPFVPDPHTITHYLVFWHYELQIIHSVIFSLSEMSLFTKVNCFTHPVCIIIL